MSNSSNAFKARIRIDSSFILAASLLLGGLILLFYQHDRQEEEHEWVIHTYQVIDHLKEIEASLVDAETGSRGYVATGDTLFLQPYYQALPHLWANLKSLPQLVADDPNQQGRVQQLDRLARAKMAVVNQLIRSTPSQSARPLLSLGKQRMDAVRRQVASIIAVEEGLMRIRNKKEQTTYHTINQLTSILIALALFNCGLSYYLVRRELVRRQRAELNLQASEQRYRSLVDQLKVIVFQTDSTGRWSYLNRAWEAITGFTVDETLGHSFLDSIAGDDRARQQNVFRQVMSGQQTQIREVVCYRHKAGGYRWIDVLAQVNMDPQQQRTGITGTLTDITDRKQAEEALIESEQRFRTIAENVDELFWIRDLHEPKFLYMNPSFERYSGLSLATLYENPFTLTTAVVEEDRPAMLDAFMSNTPVASTQFRIRHTDGSIRWLRTRLFTIKNEEGLPTRRMGVAIDVTATIEKEQILETSLQNERTVNALKSQFIATASHEFRTPLTVISLSAKLISRYVNQDEEVSSPAIPQISKHAEMISQQVMSLNELITDTLTLSKIEEGKIDVAFEWTDLVALSEEMISFSFLDRDDKRQVELAVIGQPVAVQVDRKLMTHVLTNLLSNAFKFSSVNPSLTIHYKPDAVQISVRDQGIGIPEEDLPHLFNKFFRASNVHHIKGTGLGLSICKEYVALQHGHLSVESTAGVGSTFTITLPYTLT